MVAGMYPKDCTIYIKQSDLIYMRQYCSAIHWQGPKGALYGITSTSDVDSMIIQIPLEKASLDDWQASKFGYIVKGDNATEITDAQSLKDFLKSKPYTITNIYKVDYSIYIEKVWRIYAK